MLVTEPKQIHSVFQSFYAELYKSEVVYNKSACNAFLNKLELPCLSEEEAKKLADLISLEELEQSVREMQTGKSPAIDRIPPEFINILEYSWSIASKYDKLLYRKGLIL